MTTMADPRTLALLLSNQIDTLVLFLLRDVLDCLGHSLGAHRHRDRGDEDATLVRVFAVTGRKVRVDSVEDTLDFGFLGGFLLVDNTARDL